MKFSAQRFFSKCEQIHSFFVDFYIFTKEILNGKLRFLRSVLKGQFSTWVSAVANITQGSVICPCLFLFTIVT